ncbi:uncharacterized protein PRCAT00004272001 [Priceomyces carsonii]|uniref:uncharacterized protein n=1 Tax=Priceomyces carsonii TaxID=28549 RepID=UPI002ED8DB04|nr:unnamed protein product [Priceomyces carsonii]
MSYQQQKDVLDRSFRLLTKFCGKPPKGYVAPYWETSQEGVDLLLSYGVEYDHSMSHHDCQLYWLRTGDSWTKIDYSKKAEDWMKPLIKGKDTGMVEIPGSWHLDDLEAMMFVKNNPDFYGWANARDMEDIWKDHFDYFYREYDEFVFPITCHPDASGRPHALLMHERLIEYINKHDGVEWVTMGEVAKDFKEKNPYPDGANKPLLEEEVLKRLNITLSTNFS